MKSTYANKIEDDKEKWHILCTMGEKNSSQVGIEYLIPNFMASTLQSRNRGK